MVLLEHKKARLNYELLETYEAGIELLGFEVKSLRGKRGSLEGAHVIVRGGEVFLVGATIPPYQPNNTPKDYEPARGRRLLLTRKEIERLAEQGDKKGLTIIPLSIYNKGRKIKVSLGVGVGKKKHDKRELIKKRESEREIMRTLKRE